MKEITFLNTKREWLILDLQICLLMLLNRSFMQKQHIFYEIMKDQMLLQVCSQV